MARNRLDWFFFSTPELEGHLPSFWMEDKWNHTPDSYLQALMDSKSAMVHTQDSLELCFRSQPGPGSETLRS